jgi:hypothetical protein
MKDFLISFIRTSLIPPAGGFAIFKLLRINWDFGGNTRGSNYLVFVLLSGVYYLFFRFLETVLKNTRMKRLAGYFLGVPKQVVYVDYPKEKT